VSIFLFEIFFNRAIVKKYFKNYARGLKRKDVEEKKGMLL